MQNKLILVTGATGYIASRLIPRLLDSGYRVRALARLPHRLKGRNWFRQIEILHGDVMIPSTLMAALEGVHTAYYLIHNMSSGRGYTERELEGARNFASAAESAGIEHIIYLGGLADPEQHIAPHMRSRIETGRTLRQGRVPVTEFRAGVIIGSGSISFEMIRFMTELFPIVPGSVWFHNRTQPIAVQNVVDYLVAALQNPDGRGRIFEIGGSETIRYRELILRYAQARGLKRSMFLLPYIPVWFMAFGVDLMTPVRYPIAHALVNGLSDDSIVKHDEVRHVFPEVKLIGIEEAASKALSYLSPLHIERVWDDGAHSIRTLKHEGCFVDHRELHINAAAERVFEVVRNLGVDDDWLYANWLWRLRTRADALFQRYNESTERQADRNNLKVGDRIGFYRVDLVESNRLLLHSLLKAPGEGWMEWRLVPDQNGTRLTQTSYFAPRGLPGFLYWHLLFPFHSFVFHGLIRAIAKRSINREAR